MATKKKTTKKVEKTHPLNWYRDKCMDLAQKFYKYRESYGGPTPQDRYVKCISCGKVIPLVESEGGHFITRQCHTTEIDADNIHAQCHRCNRFLSGNYHWYEIELEKRIGEERVRRLKLMLQASKLEPDEIKGLGLSLEDEIEVIRKRNKEYYKTKIEYFKNALKELMSNW